MKHTEKNSTLRVLNAHTSVRHFEAGADVPIVDEERIVTAAQRASSSCNLQAYSFVSVRDAGRRGAISQAAGGVKVAENAPLLLMVCVDLYRLDFAAEQAGLEFYQDRFLDTYTVGVVDAALAAQNAAVAAESIGYGICYLGCLRSGMEQIIELLQLPHKVFPLFALAIGVPAKKNPLKPRLPIEGVWFREEYDASAAEKAVLHYDRTMAASGVYDRRHFPLEGRARRSADDTGTQPGARSEAAGGSYGWIEHSARRISSTLDKDVRPFLRGILEKAGFGFK